MTSGALKPSDAGAAAGTSGWVAVIVNDQRDNDEVIEAALQQARVRGARVLAVEVCVEDLGEDRYDELDRRMAGWKRQYLDVAIYPVATKGSIGEFLACHTEDDVQLVVLGERDRDQIASLTTSSGDRGPRRDDCSMLIVRPERRRR